MILKFCKVGSEGLFVGEYVLIKVFMDNLYSKGIVNIKMILDWNKIQRWKFVVFIQEENIKELYFNMKENKFERRLIGNFICLNV